MANLTETATFDSTIYRLDDADPVQGWDGSTIGISNLQAQSLANRTQFLKNLVDLGGRFTGIQLFNPTISGQVRIVTAPEMKGNLFRCDTSVNDGVLSIPTAASCAEGAFIGITVEPGNIVNNSGLGKFMVLGSIAADTFFDVETGVAGPNYTIQPFTMVKLYKIGVTSWLVTKVGAEEDAPAGIISAFGGSFQPYGWLECNGSAISRTTFARLFLNIGTTFGVGNGTTTFNIPDLRGEFLRGYDNGRGIDTGRALGTAQGAAVNSNGVVMRRSANQWAGSGSAVGQDAVYQAAGPNATYGQTGTDLFGGSETRPRNVAAMFIIKF